MKELSFPEYRARHIFIAKLRLAIFIGFWFLYVILMKDYLAETKPVTVAVLICFLITTVSYYNIFNNILVLPSFTFEMAADLVAMTAVIYLTGGPESEYFIIYIFYTMGAGLFFNYRLSLLAAISSFGCYIIFLALCYAGVIPPLETRWGAPQMIETASPYVYPLLLAIFLVLSVYATKIAHYFTQNRERMLEARNKELLALQQMSSTIRTVTSLSNVLVQVVNGVLEGLNLTLCLLMLYEKEEKKVRCIPPEINPVVREIENILGVQLRHLYLPAEAIEENEAFKQLRQGRIIFRREIAELISDIRPEVTPEKFREVQLKFGIKRVIAIPLVTSREVIGSLIGFTTDAFVESKMVHTFQAFADQAALAIEAAMLIEELKKKNIALVEANRVKSEFLATMSHELRTPLTAIIGFSELLLEGVMGKNTEEQNDSLKEVLANANNLLEMINNLLDMAKIDSGKMELSRRSFDWCEMIRRIERSVAPLVKRKSHTLTTTVLGDLPVVFADEKRIQQVVLNLVGNAIKFTPDGGRIDVTTEAFGSLDDFRRKYNTFNFGDRTIDTGRFKNGVIVCSVKDNGIGISEKDLPTIFDVFHQVDSSVTKSYEGSGLGLALVKQFVELHGGFVWVESKEGVGTNFTFAIPVT